MRSRRSPLSSLTHHSLTILRQQFVRSWWRRALCLLLICGLAIMPDAGHAVSAATDMVVKAAKDTFVPVPVAVDWFKQIFRSSATPLRQDSLDGRLAYVSGIQVTPLRFVAYQGQKLNFAATATNTSGQIIQGVVFNWESSDSVKAQIDEAGTATFLMPGLVTITCRAGAVSASARVLIKPGQRPQQTDAQWRLDQLGLNDSTNTVGEVLPSLLNNISPTAYAQSNGYSGTDFGYDEIWNDSSNLVGVPRNRAIESTSAGSVLPEGSNFSFAVPWIGLGGRGVGAILALHYNSRIWSRHGNAVTFSAVGGWPFAGFSLGFGRILTYGSAASTSYVWMDEDGTRHYLGSGNASTTATYQTSDGTHITYVGSAVYGGTLYFSDGTQVAIQVYNNRLLPMQIKDSNGNYVQIAYKFGIASPLAINTVTDTQGRVTTFNYDASGNLVSITAAPHRTPSAVR